MASTNEVYGKIREMSARMTTPRPHIMISALAGELLQVRAQIQPALIELRKLRLIQSDAAGHAAQYVKLTLLGHTVTV